MYLCSAVLRHEVHTDQWISYLQNSENKWKIQREKTLNKSSYSDHAIVFVLSPKSQMRSSNQLENLTLTFSLLANLVEW